MIRNVITKEKFFLKFEIRKNKIDDHHFEEEVGGCSWRSDHAQMTTRIQNMIVIVFYGIGRVQTVQTD